MSPILFYSIDGAVLGMALALMLYLRWLHRDLLKLTVTPRNLVVVATAVGRSAGRKLLLIVAWAVAGWVMLELATYTAHWVVQGRRFSSAETKQAMQSQLSSQTDFTSIEGQSEIFHRQYNLVEIIHPYLGFVQDPIRNSNVNDFGLPGGKDVNPILSRSPDTVIIGMFGGSFAGGTYWRCHRALPSALASLKKKVMVVNYSVGGHKQPQQLIALSYFLSLGAQFDIVINIDGFNEVALSASTNVRNGVYPYYPSGWYYRSRTMIDAQEVKKIGYLELLKNNRKTSAELFSKLRAYNSPFVSYLWQLRDRRAAGEIYKLQVEVEQQRSTAHAYVTHGPKCVHQGDDQLYGDLAKVWARSSLQMKLLCEANGIAYFHFLQPNQYVEGSKPMGQAEKGKAFKDDHQYRSPVAKGYPHLRNAGRNLVQWGVNFHDLTMIYSNRTEALYVDDCCHVSREGYDLVAEVICQAISDSGFTK